MPHVRTIILGAGPAGLSLANRLRQLGDGSFVVFEKEAEAGGLCRSREVDGGPLDIGGGHFLDTRRPAANAFLFGFLPETEWDTYQRASTIRIHGQEIDYPFEANLWQFPVGLQLDYLESIARAGCIAGKPMPATFRAWAAWKLGERIAEDYMIPYNEKIWSLDNLDELGTYWLYKLPDVSFRDTLQSCLEKKRAGNMPAHAEFFYPKTGGYGRVWQAMGEALGDKLLLNRPPHRINVAALAVDDFTCERLVTTIPWPEFARIADLPPAIRGAVASLKNAPVEIAYHPENLDSSAHWTYDPAPEVRHHRLLLRHNFCPGARGYWTETHARRAADWNRSRSTPEAGRLQGLPAETAGSALHAPGSALRAPGFTHVNDYAYPLNTVGKPAAIKAILAWGQSRNIIGLGRWGEWEHMNSDVATEVGMCLAERL